MDLGLQRFLHDIRYHRERFRQFTGVAFVVFVSAVGKPQQILLFAGGALVMLGIAMRLWASGHIKKNKALATDGPYAYVRHPLYAGNITVGFGFVLASGLWWSLPLLAGIVLAFYPHAIQQEDEKLHRLFRQDWEEWRGKTRALVPRLTPYKPGQRSSWSFKQSLRENGEPIIGLILLFWLYFLTLGLY
jgi:hypothetical protein